MNTPKILNGNGGRRDMIWAMICVALLAALIGVVTTGIHDSGHAPRLTKLEVELLAARESDRANTVQLVAVAAAIQTGLIHNQQQDDQIAQLEQAVENLREAVARAIVK